MNHSQSIFALATAPGKSGVAVVRLSGSKAKAVLSELSGKPEWTPGHLRYATLACPFSGQIIDHGMAVYFAAPHSFTGEDTAEFHIHGSRAVISELMTCLSQIPDLRMAEPGEFTRRSFLNGKMDLTQAEAVADLIDAETTLQKKQALGQLDGQLTEYYNSLRSSIVLALAHLEAYIDFPDEEIPESVLQGLAGEISEVKHSIERALADHGRGERLRDGVRVVILGAPNAGKSSLMNALAGRDVAIVSHRAGTTRDVIEVHLDIAGFPVILTDTAGLCETQDEIEEEGIRRAKATADKADIKLLLFDATQPRDAATSAYEDKSSLTLVTKSDLMTNALEDPGCLAISTHSASGIDELLKALEDKIAANYGSDTAPVITRQRHRNLLTLALQRLNTINLEAPLELTCEELRLAAGHIGKITGKIHVDELLDVIFKQFCIGK